MADDEGVPKAGVERDSKGRPLQLFSPGPANPPPHLAGRGTHLAKLKRHVGDMMGTGVGGQPVFLFGSRGMGKTALLEEFERKPPYNADVRCVDPATGLNDIDNIPGILLSDSAKWKGFRESVKRAKRRLSANASIGLPGVAGIGFEFKGGMDDIACSERVKDSVIRKCAERPMVLVVDEAHMLERGAGRFFLNYAQAVVKKGPGFCWCWRGRRTFVPPSSGPGLRSSAAGMM